MAKAKRGELQGEVHIFVSKQNVVTDVLSFYRDNDSAINSNTITATISEVQNNVWSENRISGPSLLVLFWTELFKFHFNGDRELFPTVGLDLEEDFYEIVGMVLYHGLVLYNYWPVRLSQACASVIFTSQCSDRQLSSSFQRLLTQSELDIINDARQEIKENRNEFSMNTVRNLCCTFRSFIT